MSNDTSAPLPPPASIRPVVPLQYIQSIRLVHALAEATIPVALAPEDAGKFALLAKHTGVHFHPITEQTRTLPDLHISHPSPETRIGRIARPLIFPHAIIDRCRSFWARDRSDRFTFAGLVTERRLELLRTWIDRNLDLPERWHPHRSGTARRIADHVRRKLGRPPAGTSERIGHLLLWSSTRGRVFPGKAWDEDYFKLMACAQFVLCPSGDFVWSYRFFEAVLCGAIPIVEESCPAYEGFRFHAFADDARPLVWSPEAAEANFALACNRLTVPLAELDAEVQRLLDAAPAQPPAPQSPPPVRP